MWRDWVAGGLSPELFWGYTPGEVAWCMLGVRNRKREDHRNRAWLAFQTAALSLTDPKHWQDFEEVASLAPIRPIDQIEIEKIKIEHEDFLAAVRRLKDAKRDR
jgi:hypothetical protein